jgi:septum formation protein
MIANVLHHREIILASGSPRRQQFFKDLQIPFTSIVKNTPEDFPEDLKAEQITNFLALQKAKAFDGELQQNQILITSDTIVWLQNKAINKPENLEQAKEMLHNLSGKTHEVITSVCIKSLHNEVVFFDKTQVTFKNLSTSEINFYVENYKPLDKAGAYGIQEWIGLVAIEKMNGSYTNVVGLPTNLLYQNLISFLNINK